MDKPQKPQRSGEEEVPALPGPVPPPALPAGSPFRPVSHRRRQGKLPEPPAAVERPSTNIVFDASPTTIAAALAKAGSASDVPSLAWRPGRSGDDVEIHLVEGGTARDGEGGEDGEDGAASPR